MENVFVVYMKEWWTDLDGDDHTTYRNLIKVCDSLEVAKATIKALGDELKDRRYKENRLQKYNWTMTRRSYTFVRKDGTYEGISYRFRKMAVEGAV